MTGATPSVASDLARTTSAAVAPTRLAIWLRSGERSDDRRGIERDQSATAASAGPIRPHRLGDRPW